MHPTVASVELSFNDVLALAGSVLTTPSRHGIDELNTITFY